MTTIAWDGRTLAADRCRVSGRGARQTARKLREAGDFYYAVAGDIEAGPVIGRWLAGGAKWEERPELEGDQSVAIAVNKAGAVYLVQGKRPVLVEVPEGPTAHGSGAPYALAAMACGRSAREAVEVAAKFDDGTGFGVDAVDVLHAPPEVASGEALSDALVFRVRASGDLRVLTWSRPGSESPLWTCTKRVGDVAKGPLEAVRVGGAQLYLPDVDVVK